MQKVEHLELLMALHTTLDTLRQIASTDVKDPVEHARYVVELAEKHYSKAVQAADDFGKAARRDSEFKPNDGL
ncbi:hypothetical protein [Azospirillum doebereinerae]